MHEIPVFKKGNNVNGKPSHSIGHSRLLPLFLSLPVVSFRTMQYVRIALGFSFTHLRIPARRETCDPRYSHWVI
jgi:hypothetical protein